MKKEKILEVCHKINDSHIWNDLLKVKDIYLRGRSIKLGDGEKISFWKDTWLYDKPLNQLHPDLYKLCQQKEIYVLRLNFLKISFP